MKLNEIQKKIKKRRERILNLNQENSSNFLSKKNGLKEGIFHLNEFDSFLIEYIALCEKYFNILKDLEHLACHNMILKRTMSLNYETDENSQILITPKKIVNKTEIKKTNTVAFNLG